MRNNVKTIVTAALALTLIASAVVLALALTNELTKGAIAENQRIATEKACAAVLPDTGADSFVLKEGAQWSEGIEEVYEAKSGDTLVGYVVKTSTKGKSRGFVMMTGITPDGAVAGMEVIENNETGGYVNKVADDGLFERLLGVTADPTPDTAVQGVSGATKTTKAVKEGVRLALVAYGEVRALG